MKIHREITRKERWRKRTGNVWRSQPWRPVGGRELGRACGQSARVAGPTLGPWTPRWLDVLGKKGARFQDSEVWRGLSCSVTMGGAWVHRPPERGESLLSGWDPLPCCQHPQAAFRASTASTRVTSNLYRPSTLGQHDRRIFCVAPTDSQQPGAATHVRDDAAATKTRPATQPPR